MPALVWVYDAKGEPVLHNHHWYEYTGHTPEDTAANRWNEVLHPDDAAGATALWDRCRRTGEPYATEYRIRRADGVYRWFLAQGTARMGPAGIEQWIGICTDIDDRKRDEESLKLFRALLDQSNDSVEVLDPVTGRFLDVNRTCCENLGYSREEILRLGVSDIDPTVAKQGWANVKKDVAKTGFLFLETQHMRKDGSTFPVEVNVKLVHLDRDYLVGVVRDITERKRAEESLLQSKTLTAAVLESALDCIVTMDSDGRIVEFNPSAERTFGRRRAAVLGKAVADILIPLAFRAGHTQGLANYLATGIGPMLGQRLEFTGLRADGNEFPLELSITPLQINGRPHFTAFLRDLSEQKRLEAQFRQAQKMEAFGQLAGGVAHDFNNLLTVISGYSELLLGVLPANDPKRASVKAISEAGGRAAGLTRQLLSFSRQAILETIVLDLNEVVQETEKLLRRMIGEDILLTAVLDPNISRIRADTGQIGQVLMNLAVNARDAMPKGGNLTLETSDVHLDEAYAAQHAECKAGHYVRLAVSDNGCGMTPDVKAHVFEPFFTTKGPGKGTGLGLATVFGIVKQSGGTIELYSEPGLGTTFKIYLPAVDEPLQNVANDIRRAKVVGGTETVLVVEDEDAVREIAVLALQTQGYTVMQAESGKKAMAIIERRLSPIDLLMTDVVMPGMSGRELAEALEIRHPNLKVLFVSGYTDDAVIRHGILKAEVAFFQKPYTPLALARKVREVLDKQLNLELAPIPGPASGVV
jgi:PAS domain S-box-containing protein